MATNGNSKLRIGLLHLIKWKDEYGEVKTVHIFEVLSSIWDKVSDILTLDSHTRIAIETRNDRDPVRCLRDVIEKWMQNEKGLSPNYECTWNGLLGLLKDFKLTTAASDLEEALEADISSFNNNLTEDNKDQHQLEKLQQELLQLKEEHQQKDLQIHELQEELHCLKLKEELQKQKLHLEMKQLQEEQDKKLQLKENQIKQLQHELQQLKLNKQSEKEHQLLQVQADLVYTKLWKTPPRFPQAASQPSSHKMVIIGEVGSGRTSFAQLLLNYSKQFDSTDFTLDLVKSFIDHPTKQPCVDSHIVTKPNSYTATFGDFDLDIILPPGCDDSLDHEQCDSFIANIIATIMTEIYVKCICLIVNGSSIHMKKILVDTISAILSILPEGIVNNIIVVFTHVRDECSLLFDTNNFSECQLSIPKTHGFMIDNPYATYASFPEPPNSKQQNQLRRDFEDAHKTLDQMFQVIQAFEPFRTLN